MGDDADGIGALLRQYARRVEYLVLQNTACGVIWKICIGTLRACYKYESNSAHSTYNVSQMSG
jgi:hypothetical protein